MTGQVQSMKTKVTTNLKWSRYAFDVPSILMHQLGYSFNRVHNGRATSDADHRVVLWIRIEIADDNCLSNWIHRFTQVHANKRVEQLKLQIRNSISSSI